MRKGNLMGRRVVRKYLRLLHSAPSSELPSTAYRTRRVRECALCTCAMMVVNVSSENKVR